MLFYIHVLLYLMVFKMLKQLKIITVIITLLSPSWLTASENKTVYLAGIENYKPYSYMQDNQAKGLYNDIVRELFDRAGYQVKIQLVPFKRMLSLTERGQVTAMIGTFYTQSRNEYALFLKRVQLTGITSHLFVLSSSALQSFSLANLAGKTITKKRGFILTPGYQTLLQQGMLTIIETEDIHQLIKLLLNKRVDGFDFDAFATSYYLKQYQLENTIRKLSPAVAPIKNTYIALSRRALENFPANFSSELNQIMQDMQADGTLQRLRTAAINLN